MKSGFDAAQCNPRIVGQIEAHSNGGIKTGTSAPVFWWVQIARALWRQAVQIAGEKKPVKKFSTGFYDDCCESCHLHRLARLAIVMFVLGFDVGFVFASDEVDDQLGDRNKRDDQHN